jgi:hypothetical protein
MWPRPADVALNFELQKKECHGSYFPVDIPQRNDAMFLLKGNRRWDGQ